MNIRQVVEGRAGGREFITVKTLSPARVNREYELTRKFYLGMGFAPVKIEYEKKLD
jgi:hypothetical protein